MTHTYESAPCTCGYGPRAIPMKHSMTCAWRVAWDEYWLTFNAETRGVIYTEPYKEQREGESV